jgi:hypothetical protein
MIAARARRRAEADMPERGALVAVLIVERPLCVECIADKSGIALADVEPLLHRIGTSIAIDRAVDRCRGCGRIVEVFSASRSN